MADLLSKLLLRTPAVGAVQSLFGATMTAWNPSTYANTVQTGSVTFTNLPVIAPAELAVGLVLCAQTPGGPIVLGRIYQAT